MAGKNYISAIAHIFVLFYNPSQQPFCCPAPNDNHDPIIRALASFWFRGQNEMDDAFRAKPLFAITQVTAIEWALKTIRRRWESRFQKCRNFRDSARPISIADRCAKKSFRSTLWKSPFIFSPADYRTYFLSVLASLGPGRGKRCITRAPYQLLQPVNIAQYLLISINLLITSKSVTK